MTKTTSRTRIRTSPTVDLFDRGQGSPAPIQRRPMVDGAGHGGASAGRRPLLHKVVAVTSAPVSAAQFARTGMATRKRVAPARQRIATVVLVVGTVLSLGSLVGPDWVLRVGLVIALASAVSSCLLAWREVYSTKRKHAQELIAVGRRHTADLRAERQHNADVLSTVSERAKRWRSEVDRQQTQIAGLRVEVSALSCDLGSVRRQLVHANKTITGLREAVRDRDVELALMRSVPPSSAAVESVDLAAEVHALPRRVRTERADRTAGAGDHTQSVGEARLVMSQQTVEPALPNFEADRRPA